MDDLVAGLRSPGDNERLNFSKRSATRPGNRSERPGETGVFIYNNLRRVLQEMGSLAKRAEEAKRLTPAGQMRSDPAAIFTWRPVLRDRGVSLDTSIFPEFFDRTGLA